MARATKHLKEKGDDAAEDCAFVRRGCCVRLRPTDLQNRDLFGFTDARRWVWNASVAWMNCANLAAKSAGATWPDSSVFSLVAMAQLLDAWCMEEPWLNLAPKQALQQTIMDFIKARKAFLSGAAKHPPKFKKGREAIPTLRFPQSVKLNQDSVFLPKLGWVKYRNSYNKGRGIPAGELRSATVRFEGGHWEMSLLMQLPRATPDSIPAAAVGVDAGVVHTLALSSRVNLSAPVMTAAEEKRINFLERIVARRKLDSVRRAQAQAKLNRFRSRITRRIHDWRHKTTTNLSKNHGLIAAEDLALRNMTASAKGTVEAPGTNVRQKAGLNRSLLEPGIGIIMLQLDYKQDGRGHTFIQVNPAFTSQTCPNPDCRHVHADNRLSRDHFKCVKCGHADEADFVGASNVLQRAKDSYQTAAGQAVIARRGDLCPRDHGASHSRTNPHSRE
jgi:putative transposase